MIIKLRLDTCDEGIKEELGAELHDTLVGNQDYINNNIILNIDDPTAVCITIFPECNIDAVPESFEKLLKDSFKRYAKIDG